MNDNENRRHQMFMRVQDFGSGHTGEFAANSIGRQLFTSLSAIIDELGSKGAAEVSGAVRRTLRGSSGGLRCATTTGYYLAAFHAADSAEISPRLTSNFVDPRCRRIRQSHGHDR